MGAQVGDGVYRAIWSLSSYSVDIVPIIVVRGPPPSALTGFGWQATKLRQILVRA
jgi:hypothetical protein